jgi:hypothetical protein
VGITLAGTPADMRSGTFGILVNFVLPATSASWTRAAVRFDDKIHQSGGPSAKRNVPPLFYSLLRFKDFSKVSGFGPVAKKSLHWGGKLPFYPI